MTEEFQMNMLFAPDIVRVKPFYRTLKVQLNKICAGISARCSHLP